MDPSPSRLLMVIGHNLFWKKKKNSKAQNSLFSIQLKNEKEKENLESLLKVRMKLYNVAMKLAMISAI